MKRLKKISEEVIHQNPWWTYKHDKYEKPNGEEGDYYYGVLNGNAMIIPVLPDGRLIMVVQHRYISQKLSTEFPCGGRVGDDTFTEAAKKELLEETGCTATEFIKVGSFQGLNGVIDDECHVFIAHVDECAAQKLDDTEEIEVLYRRADEIDDMIRRNDIWDGQTMAAWALARSNFIKEP